MSVSVFGLNHRSAGLDLRERIAFRREEWAEAARRVRDACGASESVLLSTCNRTEIYLAGAGGDVAASCTRFLAQFRGVDAGAIAARAYTNHDASAVRHLFRVAAGLDAMVFGETQILGQVRDAYETARRAGATGPVLNHLFQRALHVAGRIHAETEIGRGGVSVPSVAAGLASRVFEDLSRRTLLVVGAGETAELAAAAFRHRGVRRIFVANRTREHAEALASRFGGEVHEIGSLAAILPRADIVVCCVETIRPLIARAEAESAARARRGEPIVFLDLGVPRNVEPGADECENVYLFDLDDLQAIAGRNLLRRQREVEKCEAILAEEVAAWSGRRNATDYQRLVERLTETAARIAEEEARRRSDRIEPEDVVRIVRRAVYEAIHKVQAGTPDCEMEAHVAHEVRRLFEVRG